MRKLLLVCLLTMAFVQALSLKARAQYLQYEPVGTSARVEDGWYKAAVKYTNLKTYTKANYTLRVKVEYGKVTAISFGNGGSIHTGHNNEGYFYSGGTLAYEKDWQGNITGFSCRVTTSDTDGIRYYDVLIQ